MKVKRFRKFKHLSEYHIGQLEGLIEDVGCGIHEDFELFSDEEVEEFEETDPKGMEDYEKEFQRAAYRYIIKALNEEMKKI